MKLVDIVVVGAFSVIYRLIINSSMTLPLAHLYCLLTSTSLVKPIPPQNWRQESATTRTSRPHFSLHMEASWVTSLGQCYELYHLEHFEVLR